MSDKFKKLVLSHAAAVAEFRRLKKAGKEEMARCTRPNFETGECDNCIQVAYKECRRMNAEVNPYDGYSFLEVLSNMEPAGCEHCEAVMRLKKERGVAGRKIGAIRAAMTRAAHMVERLERLEGSR